MFFELCDPAAAVHNRRPVTREHQLHIELRHLVEAFEVVAQRVVVLPPHGDIRSDVSQHVIARHQDLQIWFVQTQMPRSMAGSFHDHEMVISDFELIPIADIDKVRVAGGAESEAGVSAQRLLDLLLRESPLPRPIDHGFIPHTAILDPGGDQLAVGAVEVHPRCLGRQLTHQPQMIGVEMGDEKIRGREINRQLLETGAKCLLALRTSHPGVDHQGSLFRGQDVRVDGFEGRPGNRYLDTVQPGTDGVDHESITMAAMRSR